LNKKSNVAKILTW